MKSVKWLILYLCYLLHTTRAYSSEFTVTVEPGKEDCYFVTASKDVYLEVDYQVITCYLDMASLLPYVLF